jgi:MFS family permease
MKSGSWPYIVFIYLCGLAGSASLGVLGPVAGDIATGFTVTPQDVGLAIAGQLLPLAVAGFPLGWLIDRVGVRAAIHMALLGIALTAAGNGFSPSFDLFRGSLFLQGVWFVGIMTSGQVSLMLTTSGKRQVQAITLWSTAVPIGYAVGLLMVSSFAGTAAWRTVFSVHAGVTAMLFLVSLVLPATRAQEDNAGQGGIGSVLRNPRVLRLGFALALGSIAGLGTSAVLPMYLQQSLNIEPSLSARTLAIASLAGVVGSILVGTLLAKGWPAMRVACLVAIVAVGGALITFSPGTSWNWAAAGVVLIQLAGGGAIALCFTVLPRLLSHPAQSGIATGLVGQISGIGASLSAPLFFAALGLQNSLLLAGLVVVSWAGLLLLLPVRRLASSLGAH